MKAEFPGLKVTELSGKIGEAWKTVTAEEKATYEARYQESKIKYEADMKAYNAKQALTGGDLGMDDDLGGMDDL